MRKQKKPTEENLSFWRTQRTNLLLWVRKDDVLEKEISRSSARCSKRFGARGGGKQVAVDS